MIDTSIIEQFEGFSAKPYPDPATGAKPYTIGYGTTAYPNGKKVTMKDDEVTVEQARAYLQDYITKNVKPTIDNFVKQELNANQMSAIASFIYNLGATNFKSSTLLKLINKNSKDPNIAAEFMKWNKANGKVMNGLTRRRQAESEIYFK